MRLWLAMVLGLAVIAGYAIEADEVVIENEQGAVAAGSWVNMRLESSFFGKAGTASYTARTIDPIYNKLFTGVLIPANSEVSGLYHNDGKNCFFSVDKISFKNTEILLKDGAYSVVSASHPSKTSCGLEAGQLMEFRTKQEIADLYPLDMTVSVTNDFVVAISNSGYVITIFIVKKMA